MGFFGWDEIYDDASLIGTVAGMHVATEDGDWNIDVEPDDSCVYLLRNPAGNENTNGQVQCEVFPAPVLGGSSAVDRETMVQFLTELRDRRILIVGTWSRDRSHTYYGKDYTPSSSDIGPLLPPAGTDEGKTEIHPITSILVENDPPDFATRSWRFTVFSDYTDSLWDTKGHSSFNDLPHRGENRTASFTVLVPKGSVPHIVHEVNQCRSATYGIKEVGGMRSFRCDVESGTTEDGQGFYFLWLNIRADPQAWQLVQDRRRLTGPVEIPKWFGFDTAGAGAAIGKITNLPTNPDAEDLVVFHVDQRPDGNVGFYRIGPVLTSKGDPGLGWSDPMAVPTTFSNSTVGGGVAVTDVNGNGTPDLLAFHVERRSGGNVGKYCIGWDLDSTGAVTNDWSDLHDVPGWFGEKTAAASMTAASLAGDGTIDLIVFHVDIRTYGNAGFYRVGRNLNSAGHVSGGWTEPRLIPGWFGSDTAAGGVAVGDFTGDGTLDLLAFHVDHRSGGDAGYFRIGSGLTADGLVTDWTEPFPISGWYGALTAGAAVAATDLTGNGFTDLAIVNIDDRPGENNGYYRWFYDV